jgi:aminopeptidase
MRERLYFVLILEGEMNPDYKSIAKTIVNRQVRVQPGEVVSITGGLHNAEFVEEVAVEVAKAGGTPQTRIIWESLSRRMLEEVSDEYLSQKSEFKAWIEENTDCHISISPLKDPTLMTGLNPEKLKACAPASKFLHEASVKRGARRIGVGFPTVEQAKMYGISFEKFHELFWEAASAELDKICSLCNRVRDLLQGRKKIKIVSPDGAELSFEIEGRRINMDDGVISDEDLQSGDVTANFPFGEVYLAPVESTVNGRCVFPVVFAEGKCIHNLELIYENGKVVSSSASDNHELFQRKMDQYHGDKWCLGELGIGTNHKVHEPTGCVLLDEKIFGSIHLALGENRSYGGLNQSDCHWDMVMLNPTLYVDDYCLLEQGKFHLE